MTDDTTHTSSRLESPNVATWTVVFIACGILVFVGLSLTALKAYFDTQVSRPLDTPPTAFPQPRLQTDDAADRAKLEREQRQILNGYAWVDRDQAIIRIPIDEAMKHIVARGADAFAPLQSMPAAQQPSGATAGKAP